MNKKDFRFCIDESRIEQQIVMPYKCLAFFFFFFFFFAYLNVLKARISAIMRMGNFDIY